MFLLDTHVVSGPRKIPSGKASSGLSLRADSVDASDLYLSVISVQDLEIGVLLLSRRDPVRRAALREWLDGHVLPAFTGRVLTVDTAVAVQGARLHVPNPRPVPDGLIAA